MRRFFITNVKHIRILAAVILAGAVFCAAFAGPVDLFSLKADASSADAKKRLEELQKQAKETNAAIDQAVRDKAAAEGRVKDAASDVADASATVQKYQTLLNEVQANIASADSEIASTQSEMDTVTDQLAEAEAAIDSQYAAMKKRIAYIYENKSETNLLTILFNSGSIADALNQADEVASLMAYDRQMLAKYRELKAEIEEKKAAIADKQSDLTAYQEVLNASQGQYAALRSAAGADLADANADLADANGDAAAAAASLSALQKKKKSLDSQAASAQAAYAKAIAAEQAAMEEKAGGKHEDTSGSVSASTDETTFLAATIQAEAWNQGYTGQLAVGSVIMNRVKSSLFPNTITGVITQNRQFSSYSSGMVNYYVNKGVDAQCLKVAQEVIAGKRSGDWLFFMTKAAADSFGIAEYEQIGAHVFFYSWKTKKKSDTESNANTDSNKTDNGTADNAENTGTADNAGNTGTSDHTGTAGEGGAADNNGTSETPADNNTPETPADSTGTDAGSTTEPSDETQNSDTVSN